MLRSRHRCAFGVAVLIIAALTIATAPRTGHADPLLGPALELTDVDGRPRSLTDLRGKIAVLNFWATWCRPCREEMPLLEKLHRELGPDRQHDTDDIDGTDGVVFVGASADAESTRSRIPAAIEQSGVTFDVWVGASTADMERFEVGAGLPATAILDRDGSVAFRILGPLDEEVLRDRIEWLLGPRTSAAPAARVDAFARDEHHHDHGHEGGHDHGHGHGDGDVAAADASLVPS